MYPVSALKPDVTQGNFNVRDTIHICMHMSKGPKFLPNPSNHCHDGIDIKLTRFSYCNEEGIAAGMEFFGLGVFSHLK